MIDKFMQSIKEHVRARRRRVHKACLKIVNATNPHHYCLRKITK